MAIRFLAAAGRTYSVLYRDAIGAGPWQKLADVAAPPVAEWTTVTDTAGLSLNARYYRLVTPTLP
jgi:hypothetical protein